MRRTTFAGSSMTLPFLVSRTENSEIFRNLRDFKSYKGKCGQCEYINVCGGCRARADAVHGDYLEEEPFCNYVPIKMQRESTK